MARLKKAEAAELSVDPDSAKHLSIGLLYSTFLNLALSRTKADCQQYILAGQIMQGTRISPGLTHTAWLQCS